MHSEESSLCKKVDGKITKPKLITTHTAENTIKAAPKKKNTSLFAEIKDLNFTPKDCKYHEKYYSLYSDLVKRLEDQDSQLRIIVNQM